MSIFLLLILLNKFLIITTNCQNAIYCTGRLLHTIQTANIFKDSKIFVDMHLINSVERTINEFNQMMIYTNNKPNVSDIRDFINTHFQSENRELEMWQPKDFKPNPKYLKYIQNTAIRTFAKSLGTLWLKLARRIKMEVLQNSQQYSIIPVPNGFIIPGGRFREFYYWDSYWIIKGLLISEMTLTAKGMLENFFYIVDNYGFIPNGGRIYYLDRSQPPVLTMMVNDFIKITNDMPWLEQNIHYLDKELQYWLDKKCKKVLENGKIFVMAYYRSSNDEPRPESYIEDINTASILPTMEQKRHCYRAIRSGAETGWDFSTRWFIDVDNNTKTVEHSLTKTDPTRIIPVDLNSILQRSFRILSDFYAKLKNKQKATYWRELAAHFEEAIDNVLYSKTEGVWFDYDLKLSKRRKSFYPTNLTPLWTQSYNQSNHKKLCAQAIRYLNDHRILDFDGGIPTSLKESGEQWDLPNAWAPIQSIVIFGLEQCHEQDNKNAARELAKKWITTNLKTFQRSHEMFEKYNAIYAGVQGSGGEYEVQTGFGWSNGVILELIEYYYAKNKVFK